MNVLKVFLHPCQVVLLVYPVSYSCQILVSYIFIYNLIYNVGLTGSKPADGVTVLEEVSTTLILFYYKQAAEAEVRKPYYTLFRTGFYLGMTHKSMQQMRNIHYLFYGLRMAGHGERCLS